MNDIPGRRNERPSRREVTAAKARAATADRQRGEALDLAHATAGELHKVRVAARALLYALAEANAKGETMPARCADAAYRCAVQAAINLAAISETTHDYYAGLDRHGRAILLRDDAPRRSTG